MEFNIRLFIRFFSNFLEGYGVTIQYAVVGIILSLIAGLVIGLTLCLRPAVATPILRGYITFSVRHLCWCKCICCTTVCPTSGS